MLDTAYIEELKQLDLKESKAALVEYAKTFNIVVKKNQSFDNMVEDIRTQLQELADIPPPDNQEGLTITDLIQADDEVKGTAIFVESEHVDQYRSLLAGEVAPEAHIEAEQVQTGVSIPEVKVADVEQTVSREVVEAVKPAEVLKVEEPVLATDVASFYPLPDDFRPTLQLMGQGVGAFVTLPWWIYEWITQNPDWKQKPNRFPHAYGMDTLYTLIYYIKRNGSIRIRETRNSGYFYLD